MGRERGWSPGPLRTTHPPPGHPSKCLREGPDPFLFSEHPCPLGHRTAAARIPTLPSTSSPIVTFVSFLSSTLRKCYSCQRAGQGAVTRGGPRAEGQAAHRPALQGSPAHSVPWGHPSFGDLTDDPTRITERAREPPPRL